MQCIFTPLRLFFGLFRGWLLCLLNCKNSNSCIPHGRRAYWYFLQSARFGFLSNARVHVCLLSHVSCVWLFAISWTVALPGSSAHGTFPARILKCIAIPSSRGSSQPRSPALQADSLLLGHEEAQLKRLELKKKKKKTLSGPPNFQKLCSTWFFKM